MFSHELAVEQGEIADLQARDKPGERDLGGVAHATEHAFAKEGAAELHAIDSAGQLIAAPDLDRMGVTRAVEREHGLLELGVDPGFLAVGAAGDHAGEIAVDRHREPPAPQRPHQPPGQVEAVQLEDAARVRRPPADRVALAETGKHPAAIGQQQPLGPQVAADRHQADVVGIARVQERIAEQDRSPAVGQHQTPCTSCWFARRNAAA